jgi:predicted transcriptional regulator
MAREIMVNIRLDDGDAERLDELAQATVRNRSDMIRFLIRQEWQRRRLIAAEMATNEESASPSVAG